MHDYNGFSSNERAKVGKLQFEAIKSGTFPAPTRCELCLQTNGQIQLHNEDYSKPFEDAHPICRSCHSALHIRFSNPERWKKRLETIDILRSDSTTTHDTYWWEQLLLLPIDINPANA